MKSIFNPFIYSRALKPSEFHGRDLEIKRLFSRIATGQSTAIIGQPHVGKTTLITYVIDPDVYKDKLGSEFHDIFVILDAHMLHAVQSQSEFWQRALTPMRQHLHGEQWHSETLGPILAIAEENKFATHVLEQFFESLGVAKSRLILVLDEFDDLLSHAILNSAEFYGSLRSLSSRSGLVTVLAIRRDLEQLNSLTQAINPHGSPYFNVFTEIRLGQLSHKAMGELIAQADDRFDELDRQYISAVSGRHPYLAQATAAKLWEADEEGKRGVERFHSAGRSVFIEAHQHFADTWRIWSNETRKAVTAVALSQIPRLLENRTIAVDDLVENFADYGAELELLEENGLLVTDSEGRWLITQGAFLWWLAEELRRNLREETEFKQWLLAHEMEGLFTHGEQEKMRRHAQLMGKGALSLIETFSKGVAQGAVAPFLKMMGM